MSSPRAVPSSRVAYFHRQNDALGVIPCHTVLFRRRSDALGATSTPWSPESPPELSKASRSSQTVHFHYQNIALGPGSQSMPELTPNPAKAQKLISFTTKTLPWEPVHTRAHPEAHQGPQTIHFHRQNDALAAISSPRAPRSPPELPNCHFHRQNDGLGAISSPRAPRSPPELPNCHFHR